MSGTLHSVDTPDGILGVSPLVGGGALALARLVAGFVRAFATDRAWVTGFPLEADPPRRREAPTMWAGSPAGRRRRPERVFKPGGALL